MEEMATSDPLSLLIHHTSSMEEPADWSSLSALWPEDCIEPSALSLPPFMPDSFDLSADMLAAQFLNESAMLVEPMDIKPRRLSVTSSSSDSTGTGPTFSPLPESPGYTSDSSLDSRAVADPATELAERVRQLAGVMFAVPTNGAPQSTESLPAPMLAPSTPPSSNMPAAPAAAPIIPTSIVNLTGGTRPKTSHTTIERRYRTNLNARIQSLRMAVPALRVLEDKDSGKKIKKNLKGGVIIKSSSSPTPTTIGGSPSSLNPYGEVDVIDERGYVDGVKVARKCSKANVLGKAVEYIRVLKRREMRLKNEQEGLKSLICGLVGGQALLREWEKEWRLRFGGEEKDEVGGDLNAPGGVELDDDDEEDDMDDDDDGEEGIGKKRKRAKLDVKKESQPKMTPVIQNVVLGVDGQPEKRKRGRPRKVPLPQYPNVTEQQQPQPQQYLLAVFALFSFFNSPLTANNAHHQHPSHQGHVVSSVPLAYSPEIVSQFTPPSPPLSTWRDWVQVLHLGVTVLLFVSVIVRMVGGRFGKSKKSEGQKNIEEIILGNQSIPSLTSSIKLYHSTKCSPIMKALYLYTLASSSSGFIKRIFKLWARSIWKTTTATTTKKELVVLSMDLDQIYDGFMPGVKFEITKMRKRMDDLDDDEEEELVIDVLVRRVIEMKSSKVLGKTFVREVIGGDDKKEEGEKEGEPGIRGEELMLMGEASKELGGQVEVLVRNVEKVVLGGANGLINDDNEEAVMGWKKIDDNLDEGDDSDSMLSSSTISTATSTLTSVSSEGEDEDEDSRHSSSNPFTILRALVLYRSIFSSKSTAHALVPPKISIEPPTPTTPKAVLRRMNTLNGSQDQQQQLVQQEAEEEEKRRRQMYALRRLLGSRVFEKRDRRVEDDDDNAVDGGREEEGEDTVMMEDARDRVVDMLVDAERGGRMNH